MKISKILVEKTNVPARHILFNRRVRVRVNYIIEPVIVVNINTLDDNLSMINKNEKKKKKSNERGVSKFLDENASEKDSSVRCHRGRSSPSPYPDKTLHAENITVRLVARRMRGHRRYSTNYVTFKCFIIRSLEKELS